MSQQRRLHRIKRQIHGTSDRPRLCVNVSNQHVRAQIIDDDNGRTLAMSTSLTVSKDGNLSQKARAVGEDIATRAKSAKIQRVVLDRRDKPYHGRVSALAEAARSKGLEF